MSEASPAQPSQPQPNPSRRGLHLALVVSIALNLAALGVVAGVALRAGAIHYGKAVQEMGFGPYSEALSAKDRRALRETILARAPELRQIRKDRRARILAIAEVLRRDPFDAAALHEKMAEEEVRLVAQVTLASQSLQEFLAALPEAERLAFAERLAASQTRPGKEKINSD